MTLTAPGCPAAGSLPGEVEDKITVLPGVQSVKVDVVWEPPWNKDMMSEAAKLQLGFF
jgi:metal-sulfur cluster biosynthetic enzyme